MEKVNSNVESNDVMHWYNQGEQIYCNCFLVSPEILEAVPFYEKSAEMGYLPAVLRLTCIYFERDNDKHEQWKKRCVQHKEWFLKQANSGDAQSECDMGLYYRLVEQDNTQAFELYHKSERQNYPMAYLSIFEMYKDGLGTKQNMKKAFEVCLKAAEHGFRTAQLHVGVSYLYDEYGVEQNYKEAKKWILKALENKLSLAMFWMGRLYHNQNKFHKAVAWYEKSGDSEGMYDLAMMYLKKDWNQKDPTKAVSWMRRAAEQGDVPAMMKLAEWFFHGEHMKKNFTEAVHWLQQVVIKEETDEALYMLGKCYYHGNGVKQDFEEAVYWYEKAVKKKSVPANLALALCYEYGEGVPQDLQKAFSIVKEYQTYAKSTKRRLEEVTRVHKRPKEEASEYEELLPL